jgi:hypothetical protein
MPIPNVIKYSTTPDSKSLKVGNFSLGVSNSAYGETSSTGYWNGISPPTSGYTIYENKVANGPSIRVPSSSAVLIDYSNRLYSGSSITTEAGALTYFNSLNTVICVNRDYEEIVTSGLTVNLDAGFTPSYPKSGTSWTDLSFSGNNATLINGPTFNSSNGGSIVFDGVDDIVTTTYVSTNTYTFSAWFKTNVVSSGYRNIISIPSGNYVLILLDTSTPNLGFWAPDSSANGSNLSTPTISTNTWYNVVFVREGNNITGGYKAYLNGILYGNANTVTWSTTEGLSVGGRADAPQPLNGNISQVLIYNRALSSNEITQNFNAQKGRYGL